MRTCNGSFSADGEVIHDEFTVCPSCDTHFGGLGLMDRNVDRRNNLNPGGGGGAVPTHSATPVPIPVASSVSLPAPTPPPGAPAPAEVTTTPTDVPPPPTGAAGDTAPGATFEQWMQQQTPGDQSGLLVANAPGIPPPPPFFGEPSYAPTPAPRKVEAPKPPASPVPTFGLLAALFYFL